MRNSNIDSHARRRSIAALAALVKSSGSKTSTPPTETSSRWWKLLIDVLVIGSLILFLNPYTGPRPDAQFQARIQTESVSFVSGPSRDAGLFAQDTGRVDISFDGFKTIELPTAETWKAGTGQGSGGTVTTLSGGSVRFRNVDLRRLATSAGTQVTLLWYEASRNGVTLKLFYGDNPQNAIVALDEQSMIEFSGASVSQSGEPESGSIHIFHDGRGTAEISPLDGRLNVSLSPHQAALVSAPHSSAAAEKPTLEALLAAAIQKEKDKPASLPAENHLPLALGSGVYFVSEESPDTSAIRGDSNTVQIRNAERTETVLRGQSLEVRKLTDRNAPLPSRPSTPKNFPSEISFEVTADGIVVNLLGRAAGLWIDGNDIRPSPAEYIRADKVLSTSLVLILLLAGYWITFRTKFVEIFRSLLGSP